MAWKNVVHAWGVRASTCNGAELIQDGIVGFEAENKNFSTPIAHDLST
jgi:hypothetical protein